VRRVLRASVRLHQSRYPVARPRHNCRTRGSSERLRAARDQPHPAAADRARGSREDRGECTRSDGGSSSGGRSIRHRHSQRRRDRLSQKRRRRFLLVRRSCPTMRSASMSPTPFRAGSWLSWTTEMLRSKLANCCPMPCPGIELAGLESFRQQSPEHLEKRSCGKGDNLGAEWNTRNLEYVAVPRNHFVIRKAGTQDSGFFVRLLAVATRRYLVAQRKAKLVLEVKLYIGC
jgi:hypothetical protein